MSSKYLHVLADFDENEIHSKVYNTLDEFVEERSDQFTLYAELEQYINECEANEEEPEYCEKSLYDLINEGDAEGEWDSEVFYEIKFSANKVVKGI